MSDKYIVELNRDIANLEKELTALRAWKAQRLNEADPKVEALVVLLGKKVDALEEWKAKARPFLEHKYNVIKQGLEAEGREDTVHPSLRPEWERMFKTLTELLGGKDED